MLRWRLGSSDKHSLHSPDPNVPHTTCLLANQEPLRDDKLSTAEMITVVWLSCAHYLYPEYQGHNTIPVSFSIPLPLGDGDGRDAFLMPRRQVTVFSTSRRSIRIVQGVINFRERTVEVRVSDIISFEEGCLKDHWREWLTLLGWAVGKPVGNTK